MAARPRGNGRLRHLHHSSLLSSNSPRRRQQLCILSFQGLTHAHERGSLDTSNLMLAKEIDMAQPTIPPWIQTLQQRDAQFAESYLAQRERILQDGAIPAKYKILMTMIVDAITAHADGVANIANRARAAGATEAEINETVEVAYLFGGTPALVTAINAFR